MGATFEQKYGDVLDEFVEYLNNEPKIIRLYFLEEAKDEFIRTKMKRYDVG